VAKKRVALGKGLDAILPRSLGSPTETILTLQIDDISPNPFQPRTQFDDAEIQTLAESILKHGLTQPIVVRPVNGSYELIVGERRLRASKHAGLNEIKAISRSVSDKESLQLALIENIDRKDLNPIEEANSFQRLSTEFALTHTEIAETFSRSRSSITNSLRLLKLPIKIQTAIQNEILTPGHARAMLRLKTETEQLSLLEQIQNEALSVRETEAKTSRSPDDLIDFSELESALRNTFGVNPKIKGSETKGTVQFKYSSKKELDMILQLLKSISPEQLFE